MKKENTNKKNSIKKIGFGLLSMLSLIALGGTTLNFSLNQKKTNFDSPLIDSIKQDGIKIKMLNSITENGYIINTYSFTLSPENATNKNVVAEASYVDGTAYDNIVEVNVDNTAKTISLKTSATTGFNKQIKVIVYSESNSNVKAEMLVDFKKKVNNVNFEKTTYEVGYCFDQLISAEDYAIYDFSKYTIDEQYSVEFKSLSIASIETHETTGNPSDYEQGLVNFLQNSINNKTIITETLLWNAFDDPYWHSYLKSNADNADAYIKFFADEVILEVKDSEDNVVFTSRNLSD